LTSGATQAVTGIYGTLLGAGGIGSALGLLYGVQTAVLSRNWCLNNNG
jgi:hypothetical protein